MLLTYLRMGITMCFLILLTLALMEPRYSKTRTAWATGIFTAAAFAGNLAILAAVGYETFARVMPLTATAPYLVLFFCLSKYRDWRTIFSMLTVISYGIAALVLGAVVSNAFFHNLVLADLIARVVFYLPICAFVLLVFRQPYLAMLSVLERGWPILCTFPALFFGAFYFLAIYPRLLHDRPENLVPLVCIVAMLFAIYGVIVLFFRYVRDMVGVREDKLLVEAQAAALRDQLDYIRQTLDRAETRRHDLAHGIASAAALLREGKAGDAQELLNQLQEGARQSANVRYCENETTNALLTVYLDKAEQEGILVKHQLNLPAELPVDAVELSTVFANALGNAIRLCKDAPVEGRLLEITFLFNRPQTQIAFEIVCPFCGQFELDAENCPLPSADPLTVGYQGIAAFVRRHSNTLYGCKIKDGRFHLRMVIQQEGGNQ